MPSPSPLLTINSTVLWLKVVLSVATLVLLVVRYRRRNAGGEAPPYSARSKIAIALVIGFACAVFHNLGTFRGDSFIHHGEMFHYYLGSKYFKELGYYDLYNAVLVADTEQGNSLAGLPFYTDLRTYKNAPREAAIRDSERVRGLFSKARWSAFKADVAFFKQATATADAPGLFFLLMDHGYNPSPLSTFVLGLLSNAAPVTQLPLLASLDVLLVAAMIALVFATFGFEMGALFSVYFFVNIFNDHSYISGSLLRFDWLFCVVAAVCLLEKRRPASSAAFLMAAAMLRVFPALLFYGIGVTIVQKARASRAVDPSSLRFMVAAAATGLALFLLPAASLGSAVGPWQDFASKAELHDGGVYVNHLGLRAITLFESSHLSLERFAARFYRPDSPDVVRNWQIVKEQEFAWKRRPIIVVASLFVLACLTTIIWRRRAAESESVLWPLLLVYTLGFPSHYYYTFLCLLILLFFRRPNTLAALVPVCLLLLLNIAALVTDSFRPSPIVFYTLANLYLFACLAAILAFELYSSVFANRLAPAVDPPPPAAPVPDAKRRKRKPAPRARRN